MAGRRRVAFVTIGQSPRDDMVPEMLTWIGPGIDPLEVGALDGLGREAIARLRPVAGDHHLVSLLQDGAEVVIGKAWVQERLKTIMADLDAEDPFLVVLLCTGHFDGVRSRALMIESQRIVDHAVDALTEDGRSLGVMLPIEEQIPEFHAKATRARSVVYAHASPYSDDRFDEAARELAGTDLIVMHCMGYTEAMRRRVADVSGRPVLLARRLVAGAIAQLL